MTVFMFIYSRAVVEMCYVVACCITMSVDVNRIQPTGYCEFIPHAWCIAEISNRSVSQQQAH
jgi:hypothetical protein